jgi:hypothetical protein
MKVEVLSEETVIGICELDKLDPPMGGASGPFIPTADKSLWLRPLRA